MAALLHRKHVIYTGFQNNMNAYFFKHKKKKVLQNKLKIYKKLELEQIFLFYSKIIETDIFV